MTAPPRVSRCLCGWTGPATLAAAAAHKCKAGGAVSMLALPTRPGLDNEIALARALLDAGLTGYEVQWPWGMLLKPARRFVADIGYPKQRVIVESVGRAHAAGVEKVYKDAERSALAASIGSLIVPLHPGMIHDGEGMKCVAAALAAREAR